eukprot:c9933_g1_i1 orf=188-1594(-)
MSSFPHTVISEGLKHASTDAASHDPHKREEVDDCRDMKDNEDAIACQATPPLPAHSRHTSSKYDFVKVRVWLGDNADHYYVLSRFLVSRMLTVTKIPNHVAIKISLELKKLLIDNSLFDVSQSDLEANLFKLMERRGYGEEYINRYKMMTRFHHQRVPLVILVCGTACVGKSTVATQLAQRLNLPNVLQTDMVYELIRTSTDSPLSMVPIWEREFASQEELVKEFARECRILRKGLNGDLRKAMKDGKPIIIEGIHLDPSIYVMDEECSNTSSSGKPSHLRESDTSSENAGQLSDSFAEHDKSSVCPVDEPQWEGMFEELYISRFQEMNRAENCTSSGSAKVGPQRTTGELAVDSSSHGKKKSAKAIIVPIVLKMDEFDHKTLLEEWIACRSPSQCSDEEKKEIVVNNLMTIQDYLCSFKSQGIIVRNVSTTTFPQTLDALHSYLLQCIEEECQRTAKETVKEDTDQS